jgi:hypothetical protein
VRPKDLSDLADVLDAVRLWPHVSERSPGVFWIRRTPFLHFHVKGDDRRAHAKRGTTWAAEMPVPFGIGRRAKAAFLGELRDRYAACVRTASSATTRPACGVSSAPP